MRDAEHYIFSQDERDVPAAWLANIPYFALIFFALLSFCMAIALAAIAINYLKLPPEYSDLITDTIACKGSGIAAFLGLGLACFATLNKISR